MIDVFGNNINKIQNEIIDITNNIYKIRNKNYKSMSSILDKIESKLKLSSSSNNLCKPLSRNKNYSCKKEKNKKYISKSVREPNQGNNNIKSKKDLYYSYDIKKNNLNSNKKNIKKDILSKNYFPLNNILTRNKNNHNQKIKLKFNNYKKYISNNNNNELNNDIDIDKGKKILKHQLFDYNKSTPKTYTLHYIYNDNLSDDYLYNNEDIKINYNNNKNINNTNINHKRTLNNKNNINKPLNKSININQKCILKKRNRSSNELKPKNISIQKNDEEYYTQKALNKIPFNYNYKDYKNNSYNFSFYNEQGINNIAPSTYMNNIFQHKIKKNIFREKASKKNYNIENDNHKYIEFYKYNKDDFNSIPQLLNTSNPKNCVTKIKALLTYEDFINHIKNLYYKYNDYNNNIKLKDIFFWLYNNININKNNNKNLYEDFCEKIMKKHNISDFENFKIFFNDMIENNKKNVNFMNEMKELLEAPKELFSNKSSYMSSCSKKIKNLSNSNYDDITK